MSAEKRFSRFILYVLVVFQGVSLAFIVGVLYGILSRTLSANFYNQIRADAAEATMVLHDRISHVKCHLQELRLNNTVRVALMLGVENPVLEVVNTLYPYANGAFYCVKAAGSSTVLPPLPEKLCSLRSLMERLSAEETGRQIRLQEPGTTGFLALLSGSIMRKEERLGTAYACYVLGEDSYFWKRINAKKSARLLAQSGHGLVDLRSGREMPISGDFLRTGNEMLTDGLSGHALVPLQDFPGIFYARSSLSLEKTKIYLILILAGICALVFLFTVLVGFLIARRVTRPLRGMVDQAQEIALKPTGRFLNPKEIRHSEFRTLARAFNRVLAGLFKAQKELQKKAKKELAASDERYRRTLEAAPDAVILTTLKEGRFLQVNEGFTRLTGYTAEEVLGKTVADLNMFTKPADENRLIKVLKEQGEANALELRTRRKNGAPIDTLVSARCIRFGNEDCLITVVTDITVLKKAQEEKARLEKRLQQAKKMEAIGALAGGVAHDLNNILSGIISYPELMLMDLPEDSPMVKPLLTIQRSGEKAAAIVQDLLTLARRGVAVAEVVNLNNIVSEYLASPEYEKLRSYHRKASAAVALAPDLLNIHGSPVHLSKTVMNLVANAFEAMPEGGKASISTQNMYVDRPIQGYEDVNEGDYVVLTVADTGTGISPEDMERIFEPFYTKKHMGRSGTGLGLSVVMSTVKRNGGTVLFCRHGEFKGFDVAFPVQKAPVAGKEGGDGA